MKRTGILHRELSDAVASLGHYDLVVLSDAGLPVPPAARRVELALAPDLPGVPQVLEVLLQEMLIEKVTRASEQAMVSPRLHARIDDLLAGTPIEDVPHAEFRVLAATAKVHIRTGDFTPYANLILTAGWIGRPTQAGRGDSEQETL